MTKIAKSTFTTGTGNPRDSFIHCQPCRKTAIPA